MDYSGDDPPPREENSSTPKTTTAQQASALRKLLPGRLATLRIITGDADDDDDALPTTKASSGEEEDDEWFVEDRGVLLGLVRRTLSAGGASLTRSHSAADVTHTGITGGSGGLRPMSRAVRNKTESDLCAVSSGGGGSGESRSKKKNKKSRARLRGLRERENAKNLRSASAHEMDFWAGGEESSLPYASKLSDYGGSPKKDNNRPDQTSADADAADAARRLDDDFLRLSDGMTEEGQGEVETNCFDGVVGKVVEWGAPPRRRLTSEWLRRVLASPRYPPSDWCAGGRLAHITNLRLDGNRLTTFELPRGALPALTELNLEGNNIKAWPIGLGTAWGSGLERLNLASNELRQVGEEVAWGALSSLTWLSLKFNKMVALPDSIQDARQLQALDVSNNELGELPETICEMDRLSTLELSGNPLCQPPLEIAIKGLAAIAEYFYALNEEEGEAGGDCAAEAAAAAGEEKTAGKRRKKKGKEDARLKLVLVGEGSAGKTSLLRTLQKNAPSMTAGPDESTIGIDINCWKPDELTTTDETPIRLSCWDFAGQSEIYSSFQAAFFSKRALFVLVVDIGSTQETALQRTQFWVDVVQARVPGASIILVANKADTVEDASAADRTVRDLWSRLREEEEVRLKELNAALVDGRRSAEAKTRLRCLISLRPQFSQFFKVSCRTLEGIEALRLHVFQQVCDKHKAILPTQWHVVDEYLADYTTRASPPIADFETVAKQIGGDCGVKAHDVAAAAEYLEDIGEIVRLRSARRRETLLVLKPEWLMNQIKRVINHKMFAEDGRYRAAIHKEVTDARESDRLIDAFNDLVDESTPAIIRPQLLRFFFRSLDDLQFEMLSTYLHDEAILIRIDGGEEEDAGSLIPSRAVEGCPEFAIPEAPRYCFGARYDFLGRSISRHIADKLLSKLVGFRQQGSHFDCTAEVWRNAAYFRRVINRPAGRTEVEVAVIVCETWLVILCNSECMEPGTGHYSSVFRDYTNDMMSQVMDEADKLIFKDFEGVHFERFLLCPLCLSKEAAQKRLLGGRQRVIDPEDLPSALQLFEKAALHWTLGIGMHARVNNICCWHCNEYLPSPLMTWAMRDALAKTETDVKNVQQPAASEIFVIGVRNRRTGRLLQSGTAFALHTPRHSDGGGVLLVTAAHTLVLCKYAQDRAGNSIPNKRCPDWEWEQMEIVVCRPDDRVVDPTRITWPWTAEAMTPVWDDRDTKFDGRIMRDARGEAIPDCAVLRLAIPAGAPPPTTLPGGGLRPTSGAVNAGERLFLIGYPQFGKHGLCLSPCQVVGLTTIDGVELVEAKANNRAGCSGGPVLDQTARVCGILSKGGIGIAYVVPMSIVLEVVDDAVRRSVGDNAGRTSPK